MAARTEIRLDPSSRAPPDTALKFLMCCTASALQVTKKGPK